MTTTITLEVMHMVLRTLIENTNVENMTYCGYSVVELGCRAIIFFTLATPVLVALLKKLKEELEG